MMYYEMFEVIEKNVWDVLIDWFVFGIDLVQVMLFIQSKVFEYVEFVLLFGMSMLFGWFECVLIYKEQMEKLKDKDLFIYGFFGYLVLMVVDILLYCGLFVLVGEDQVLYVEMMCEIVCCFNYLYGCEFGFEEKVFEVVKKFGGKCVKFYYELCNVYQQEGDDEVFEQVCVMLQEL